MKTELPANLVGLIFVVVASPSTKFRVAGRGGGFHGGRLGQAFRQQRRVLLRLVHDEVLEQK